MDVVSLIIKIMLCLFSLFLIVVVLLQSDKASKTVVSGGTGKKVRGIDALLVRLTKISAVAFMVLSVALILIQQFF